MRYLFLLILSCLIHFQGHTKTVRALFLGNSYTDVNNLPEIIRQLALASGDTLIYSKNTPGGYTLQGHSTNASSLAYIQSGNWDFVILQEQSQLPSFPEEQVITEVYPYAHQLDSIIHVYSPCATTVFYNTWGRKNGDASNCAFFPPVCTYLGMDSLLQLRYRIMAESNHAAISPVAALWRNLRNNYPGIELYQTDESHPSAAGSYAAACSFYAILFQKDPGLNTYSYTLSFDDANTIRNVSKALVYDSLAYWNRFRELPKASFSTQIHFDSVVFTNTSLHAGSYLWDFGDGKLSTETSPTHVYETAGTYTVTLRAQKETCDLTDTVTLQMSISKPTGTGQIVAAPLPHLFPNPVTEQMLTLMYPYAIEKISVYNLQGIEVFTALPETQERVHTLAVNTLPQGVYFIQLTEHGTQRCITTKFYRH